jgi:hypothetical protein
VQNAGCRIVYLDLNHWYILGEAMAGRPRRPEHVDVLQELTEQVEQGLLMFPLSAVHHIELAENPRDHQREEAANVMAALSQFRTITPTAKIIDEELAHELNRRFGRPAFPIKVHKFGYGATFALTGKEGRGRLTGGSEDDRRELEAKLGKPVSRWEAEVNTFMEYELLKQPSADLRSQIPDYDPYAARRIADEELDDFNVLVNTVRTKPDIAARLLDAVCARHFLFEFRDNYTRALMSAGFMQSTPFHNKEQLTDFLMSLPSRRVATMLQFHYLKNGGKHWKINDLRDNTALSEAIPYCDIVVTDSEVWDVAVNRAHLDREFDTPIFRRLTDLAAYLA